MKRLVTILVLLVLAGCATERSRPVYLADGSGYYYAERAYPSARSAYGRDRLFLYGVYPWWTYDFYSPYFYPYRFTYYHPFYDPFYGRYMYAGWSPVWPYHGGYYGRYGWATVPYRQPPVSPTDPRGPVGRSPGIPPGPFIADEHRRRAIDQRSLMRERMYRRPSAQQPGVPGLTRGAATTADKPQVYGSARYGSTRRTYGGAKANGSVVPRAPAANLPQTRMPAASPRPRSGPPSAARFDRSDGNRPRTQRDR